MREAVIVAASRTAVGKSGKGSARNQRSDEMAATVIQELLRQTEGKLRPEEIDDVFLGCAMPEGSQGLNTARVIALRAGLPVDVPAQTVNRFCSSGLQTIASAAERIIAGGAETVVAGGVETMSLVPMTGFRISPNPYMAAEQPEVYMNMGLTAERVADEFEVSRQAQDEFALRSHQRAIAAIDADRFGDETVPVTVRLGATNGGPRPEVTESTFADDEGPRRDTSLDALGQLRPAFHAEGTVTAGNSSQTSDGAAALVVTSAERARQVGAVPLARFLGFATAGVEPERFGIGPVPAVRKVLEMTGLTLDQIDLVELNEAFAAQVLACLRELPIDPERLNVNGGAIALGHPLGCTGARLTTSLLHEMRRRRARYGLVTMCVGGGMGAAGIFERVEPREGV